jgi:hypothetical protein
MVKIRLPDGRNLAVPGGLTEAQMEEALRKHMTPRAPAAPAPTAAPRDPNRSPRAMPLPPTEMAPDVTPLEAEPDFFTRRRRPQVVHAYRNAKPHLRRR